jgi:hypothetical protein
MSCGECGPVPQLHSWKASQGSCPSALGSWMVNPSSFSPSSLMIIPHTVCRFLEFPQRFPVRMTGASVYDIGGQQNDIGCCLELSF